MGENKYTTRKKYALKRNRIGLYIVASALPLCMIGSLFALSGEKNHSAEDNSQFDTSTSYSDSSNQSTIDSAMEIEEHQPVSLSKKELIELLSKVSKTLKGYSVQERMNYSSYFGEEHDKSNSILEAIREAELEQEIARQIEKGTIQVPEGIVVTDPTVPESVVAPSEKPEEPEHSEPVATPRPVVTPTPSTVPTATPVPVETATPTPSNEPTTKPTTEPTSQPTSQPTPEPVVTPEPTPVPTPEPVVTPEPTPVPTPEPVVTPEPTPVPTPEPIVTPEPPAHEHSWTDTGVVDDGEKQQYCSCGEERWVPCAVKITEDSYNLTYAYMKEVDARIQSLGLHTQEEQPKQLVKTRC